MLKNMWYACEFSKDITTKPKQVHILGQKLVMWRDSKGEVALPVRPVRAPRRLARRRLAHQGQQLRRVPVPRLGVRG